MGYQRKDLTFASEGTRCSGWLYYPEGRKSPPVVVMAHGFGGERVHRLPAYAERFAESGLATFLFDYRNFGDSDGEPRNLIDPFRHCTDWESAVEFVRNRPEVDGSRLALWGTSFSGGHVVRTAAETTNVSAVIAQTPFSDGLPTTFNLMRQGGVSFIGNALATGSTDGVRLLLGLEPYYVPIVETPGEFGVLNTPGAKDGYEKLVPEGHDWENRCPARILFTTQVYRPVSRAEDVNAPVLVVQAGADRIIPASTTEKLVDRLETVKHLRYEAGHFDVYFDEPFEEITRKQVQFLKQNLKV